MAKELLLTAQGQNSQQISCCFWDYNNGNLMQIYKNGGSVSPKSLNIVAADYILTAEKTKPVLHLWPLNGQEPLKDVRLILPEPAHVVEVCPKNTYMAVGINSKIYIWELCSGKLITCQQIHYQPITCIKFSNGLEYVIITGEDGMIVVYHLTDLISPSSNNVQIELGQIEPLYRRMDHSLPINDVYVTKFSLKSRFATVSSDQTLRLYQLNNGALLLTLIFDTILTSVVFDSSCFNIFVGNNKGLITRVDLTSRGRYLEEHVGNEEATFVGHKETITDLQINIFNNRLASASEDCKVLIWDLSSCQILRTIEMKSVPTNIRFVLTSEQLFNRNSIAKVVILSLNRSVERTCNQTHISWLQAEECNVTNDFRKYILEEERKRFESVQCKLNDIQYQNLICN